MSASLPAPEDNLKQKNVRYYYSYFYILLSLQRDTEVVLCCKFEFSYQSNGAQL